MSLWLEEVDRKIAENEKLWKVEREKSTDWLPEE